MEKELICIICPNGCRLKVDENFNVTGNKCPRGAVYAKNELTHPTRTITSTVKIISKSERVLPVKTSLAIPKEKIFEAMKEINKITVKAPIKLGDIVIENLLGLGVNVISTKEIKE